MVLLEGEMNKMYKNKIHAATVVLLICIFSITGCTKQEKEEIMKKIEIQVSNDSLPKNDVTIEISQQGSGESAEVNDTQTGDESKEGKRSILDFLKIAIQPVGKTMYIWGGGWNEEDTAAGIEAVTLGVSPRWAQFASMQDSSYDYNTTRYQIHDGLDCSGYVGWAVYNLLENENGHEGYVLSASKMASDFANRGLGTYIPVSSLEYWQAGDIMSMDGHVWIVVGICEDGSVLLLHASPPGVIFSGTKLADGSNSQAIELAKQIMKEHYPDWYDRYPDCARGYFYLTGASAMRWDRKILSDEEGLCSMTAEEVIGLLY